MTISPQQSTISAYKLLNYS